MSVKLKTRLQEEIHSEIEKIRSNQTLLEEKNFNARLEAIDYLEFHVIERLHVLMESRDIPGQMNVLKEYAQKVKDHLEEVNNKVFLFFRKKIQEGHKGKVLMELMDEYFDGNINGCSHQVSEKPYITKHGHIEFE